jgi:hypothetical protein
MTKIFISIGAAILILAVGGVVITSITKVPQPDPLSETGELPPYGHTDLILPKETFPENENEPVFLSADQVAGQIPAIEKPNQDPVSQLTIPSHDATILPSPDFFTFFSPPPFISIPTSPIVTLLEFPPVAVNELHIASDGVNDLSSFAEYFTRHINDIQYDISALHEVLRDDNGVILSPEDLVLAGLTAGNFSTVHPSLALYDAFLNAKIAFLKTVPVKISATNISQEIIGADMLTRNLIGKVFAAEAGVVSKETVAEYRTRYIETITTHQKEIVYHEQQSENALVATVKFFLAFMQGGAVSVAHAQASVTLGFGGLITMIQECTCSGGYIMWLTPGYAPIGPATYPIFISYATIASPLLYLNKAAIPTRWILGNYLELPGPCLSVALCIPDGAYMGIVTMAGTS